MIGMFDSGVGGLTVYNALKKRLPHTPILYYGDTARVPYGNKSAETLQNYSLEIAQLLQERGAQFLLVACNSATAAALPLLQSHLSIPVMGVIEPSAKAAALLSKNGKIALLATRATVASKAYEKELASQKLTAIPTPLLAPLIEEGYTNHPIMRLALQEYLPQILDSSADTVILGCTHYPLIKPLLEEILPPSIQVLDCAEATAQRACELFTFPLESGEDHFFVSDVPEKFAEIAAHFTGKSLSTFCASQIAAAAPTR